MSSRRASTETAHEEIHDFGGGKYGIGGAVNDYWQKLRGGDVGSLPAVLGALVLDEPIAAAVVGGGAIVVVGVGLVVSSERPRRAEPQPVGAGAEVVDLRT